MILKRLLDLAYGAATVGVKLAFKKNILVAYMPREGYNFKDVVLIGYIKLFIIYTEKKS